MKLAWRRLRPAADDAKAPPAGVQALLERVPRRTVERHAADQATPIWVAQALVGWLRWGWTCLTHAGLWRPIPWQRAPAQSDVPAG